MGLLKTIEYLMGMYKYPAPILKLRSGSIPVWVFDRVKKVKSRGGIIEYTYYKTNGKFPPPRANEIGISDKGKDVFPKIQLEDNTFLPLNFMLGEEKDFYICKGCRMEFDDPNEMTKHLNNCDKIKEIIDAEKKE